jgi:hypothetical protein
VQQRRIHDHACTRLQSVPRKIAVHRRQHLAAQPMAVQQMAKLAHGGLIRSWLHAQVDAHKTPHRHRVVQRILDGGVGQIEPLLEK